MFCITYRRVLEEILQTEEIYVADLKIIEVLYILCIYVPKYIPKSLYVYILIRMCVYNIMRSFLLYV